MTILGPISDFSKDHAIFTTNKRYKYAPSIRCWDSNSCSLEHAFPTVTT